MSAEEIAARDCKKASKSLIAAIAANQIIARYNTGKDLEQGSAYLVWQGKQSNYQTNLNNWNASVQSIKAAHIGDDMWTDCDHDSCPGDFPHYKGHQFCNLSGINAHYKQNCGISDQHANNIAISQSGSAPNFTEPAPEKNKGDYVYKTETSLTGFNVTCCQNIVNVVGSHLENVTIEQVNSCGKDLDNKITKAKADKVISENKAIADKAAADKIISDAANKKMYMYIGIGIGIFLLLCCCSSSIIGIASGDGDGDD